jgi:hypothetical protein
MKKLIALVSLALTLPLACKGKDVPPNPLATRSGFCQAWAEAACQDKVVTNCNANKTDDCINSQSDFCLSIVPEKYDATNADACISAVKDAYADAELSPDDIAIVIKLGAPCDKLSAGSVKSGGDCSADYDCDTAQGLACIQKQGAKTGICGTPEVVGPGDACDGPKQVCDDKHFCNGENCVAFKKEGFACDGDYECDPTDHCVIATGAAATSCEARLGLNETCTSDDDCASRYCAIAPKDTEGQCASTIVLTRTEPLCLNLR